MNSSKPTIFPSNLISLLSNSQISTLALFCKNLKITARGLILLGWPFFDILQDFRLDFYFFHLQIINNHSLLIYLLYRFIDKKQNKLKTRSVEFKESKLKNYLSKRKKRGFYLQIILILNREEIFCFNSQKKKSLKWKSNLWFYNKYSMGKKKQDQLIDSIVSRYEKDQNFGRKPINHVVPRKKKRINSIVSMKPLKKREKYFQSLDYQPKGYTKGQFDLYRVEAQRLRELTKEDLKQILKLNKQDASSLIKDDLVHRCADGYALGRIPLCPHCFGTTPYYDKNTGQYFCAGYRQDEDFIKCQSFFSKDDIQRIKPWDNNFEIRQEKRLKRTQQKLRKEREYQINYKLNKKEKNAKDVKKQADQEVVNQSQSKSKLKQEPNTQEEKSKKKKKKKKSKKSQKDLIALEKELQTVQNQVKKSQRSNQKPEKQPDPPIKQEKDQSIVNKADEK